MERLIETDNVMVDYFPNGSEGEYRLSVFDKYGHYLDEMWLDSLHISDLIESFKETNFNLKKPTDIL